MWAGQRNGKPTVWLDNILRVLNMTMSDGSCATVDGGRTRTQGRDFRASG